MILSLSLGNHTVDMLVPDGPLSRADVDRIIADQITKAFRALLQASGNAVPLADEIAKINAELNAVKP